MTVALLGSLLFACTPRLSGGSLPIADQWFSTVQLQPPAGAGYELYRTREIHETTKNAGVNGNYYLLKGPSVDLLIDTGMGVASLRSHLEGLGLIGGARPLQILATHEHFDHTGGLKDFQNATIILGDADADSVERGNTFRTLAVAVKAYGLRPEAYWNAAPSAHFRAELMKYEVKSRVDRRVKYSDSISLGGGVSFAVLELPGHTPGSIGLWNENGTKELYAGDAIYDAELFDFLLDSDKGAYRAAMELLAQLNVSVTFPGHEEVLNHSRYLQLVDCYMSGMNPCPKSPQEIVV